MKQAFDFYKLGHAANRAERPFDIALERKELARLGDMAGETPVCEPAGAAEKDGPQPIFVVGMPRSGTTLTERILGAHPDVYAAGEIGDFAKAVIDVVGVGPISEQLARIDRKAAARIRKQYLDALKAYASEKRFVTNKTPANFLRIEMIRRVFPRLRSFIPIVTRLRLVFRFTQRRSRSRCATPTILVKWPIIIAAMSR